MAVEEAVDIAPRSVPFRDQPRLEHAIAGLAARQHGVVDLDQLRGLGLQVDFLWRTERLIVETDGRETHATRQAFERDRRRDQELTVDGFRVVRFTHRQLTREPTRVAETVRALLGR